MGAFRNPVTAAPDVQRTLDMSQSKKSKEIRRPAETLELDPKSEDEILHVPKGASKARFYFLLFLTVFVLLVFVVADPLMSTAGGGAEDDSAYMRWTGPDGKERSLSGADFMSEKRSFGYLNEGVMRALSLGAARIQRDEEAARLILLDDIAKSWGIEITDREVARQLYDFFGPDLEGYAFYLRNFRTLSKAQFENVLRSGMRIQRFQTLLAAGIAVADPDTLVERWQDGHEEYAFDYIELESASLTEEARAEVPSDEELETWLAGRNEFERSAFMRPESYTIDAVYLPFGEELDGTLLLERYPRPEDEVATDLARDYYNRFTHVRFQRPEPLPEPGEGEEGEEPTEGVDPVDQDPLDERDRIYFTFDEVEAQAAAEAPLYYAMSDWLNDVRTRMAEGSVDLVQEAAEFGLQYELIDTPYDRTQWTEEVERPWLGRFVVGSHQNVQPGQLVNRVVVEEGAIVVSRVLERFPRALPPFAEIRDRVAESWATARATELGLAKLEAFHDRLQQEVAEGEELPPETVVVSEERIRELATEAGLTVQRRDYKERFSTDIPEGAAANLENYLRISSFAFSLEEGAVPPPAANRAGSHSFLLRMAGSRDSDLGKMKPADITAIQNSIQQQRLTEFFQSTFQSEEYLKERYGLWLRTFDEE